MLYVSEHIVECQLRRHSPRRQKVLPPTLPENIASCVFSSRLVAVAALNCHAAGTLRPCPGTVEDSTALELVSLVGTSTGTMRCSLKVWVDGRPQLQESAVVCTKACQKSHPKALYFLALLFEGGCNTPAQKNKKHTCTSDS